MLPIMSSTFVNHGVPIAAVSKEYLLKHLEIPNSSGLNEKVYSNHEEPSDGNSSSLSDDNVEDDSNLEISDNDDYRLSLLNPQEGSSHFFKTRKENANLQRRLEESLEENVILSQFTNRLRKNRARACLESGSIDPKREHY
ncbi:hypothetical protein LWI28_020381 [Acer negundo]|uniref:Uncharacterized protein n=1 Tax=Acer negundo TaxID=4023 RepID=A0AAD5NFX5_ACENE|nr:hypothetical protein LWI28_020381 [Acer negundo]